MKLLVLNGPNINLLGKRESDVYGNKTYQDLINELNSFAHSKDITLDIKQSNHEGVLIDLLQEADGIYDGVIINGAAYTHTSIALRDTIKAIQVPCIEVHLSNPKEREEFRHQSFLEDVCVTTYSGEHFNSYLKAIKHYINN